MAYLFPFESKTFRLKVNPPEVLSSAHQIIVTLNQGGLPIEKTGEDLDIDTINGYISFKLSQEDTSKFIVGKDIEVQINISYDYGEEKLERDVSFIKTIKTERQLHKEVMKRG